MEGYHESVLLQEVLKALSIKKGSLYLDCTLGDGGHTIEILKKGGKVVGIDTDPGALERTRNRLQNLGFGEDNFTLIHGNFRDASDLVGEKKFAGILLDLGVSTMQLMEASRGFAFSKDGPLDMRMDPSLGVSAKDLVNALNKGELNELFTKFGQEKLSKPIAEAIVSSRQINPIETTKQLAEIAENVYRRFHINEKIHPATRIFQALRIAINDELNSLTEVLPQILDLLDNEGRVVVLSFHSLEDKEVKNMFKNWQENNLGQALTKKPLVPTEAEIEKNPYSRSVKMRVFEKHI